MRLIFSALASLLVGSIWAQANLRDIPVGTPHKYIDYDLKTHTWHETGVSAQSLGVLYATPGPINTGQYLLQAPGVETMDDIICDPVAFAANPNVGMVTLTYYGIGAGTTAIDVLFYDWANDPMDPYNIGIILQAFTLVNMPKSNAIYTVTIDLDLSGLTFWVNDSAKLWMSLRFFNYPVDNSVHGGWVIASGAPTAGSSGDLYRTQAGVVLSPWSGSPVATFDPILANSVVLALRGRVELQNYGADTNGRSATLEFRTPNTTNVVHSYPITLDSSGNYMVLPADQGIYDVAVKFSHWLRGKVSSADIEQTVNTIDFSLVNGDVDGDNTVTVNDLNSVFINFATVDPDTDQDGSGLVDLPDLNIIFLNFAQSGAD